MRSLLTILLTLAFIFSLNIFNSYAQDKNNITKKIPAQRNILNNYEQTMDENYDVMYNNISYDGPKVTKTSTGSNWANYSHWSPSGVPNSSNDVVINSNMSVSTSAGGTCLSLTINSGRTLTINNLRTLTVATNVTNNGTILISASSSTPGKLSLSGNFTNNSGAYINCATYSTGPDYACINFAGSSAQTFTQNGNNSSSSTYDVILQSSNNVGVNFAGSNVFSGSTYLGAANAKFGLGANVTFGDCLFFNYNNTGTLYSGSFNLNNYTLTFIGAYIGKVDAFPMIGGSGSGMAFTGSSMIQHCPPIVNGLNTLTVDNSIGLVLDSSLSISGNVYLTSGEIMRMTSGVTLTLGNGANIYRSGGFVYPAPTFGTTANLTYNGSSAITTGFELPVSVLNNLTIDNSSEVTIANNGTGSTSLSTQSFNAVSLPAGWTTQIIVGTTPTLTGVTSSQYPTGITPSDGSHMLKFNSWTCNAGDVILLKGPSFSTTGYNNIIVRFDLYQENQYLNPDRVSVVYSTNSGTTWTDIGGAYRFPYNSNANAWKTFDVVLPSVVNNNSTVLIGFRFTGGYGNDTHFDNVRVYGSTPTTNTATVNGTLTISNGLLKLGANTLTVEGNISNVSPDETRMIVLDDGTNLGTLKRKILNNQPYLFYVGDTKGTIEFSPAIVTFTNCSFDNAYLTLQLVNNKEPHNSSILNYINRYWTFEQSGITFPPASSYTIDLQYHDNDVSGSDVDLYFGKLNGTTYTSLGLVDYNNNKLYKTELTSFSTFTGGESTPMPVELSSFNANVISRDVKLNWITATETNNAGFEIQKSEIRSQKQEEWVKVGYINGNGTKTTPTNYTFEEKKLNLGKYNYRLKQIDYNGNFEFHNLNGFIEIGVPNKFDISQNYPNPFNPTTKIDFDLPYDSKVTMKLYDISGREVMTLVNEQRTAGYYTVQMNGNNLSSGMYFYRIIAEGNGQKYVMTKKAILIK